MGLTGAQGYYNIDSDLTTFGKVIGGGLPVGAFGGRSDIMSLVSPEGPVYQAGTLSGNPLAMAAGLSTLSIISEPDFFKDLTQKTAYLTNKLNLIGQKYNTLFHAKSIGGMLGLFFNENTNIKTFNDVASSDIKLF